MSRIVEISGIQTLLSSRENYRVDSNLQLVGHRLRIRETDAYVAATETASRLSLYLEIQGELIQENPKHPFHVAVEELRKNFRKEHGFDPDSPKSCEKKIKPLYANNAMFMEEGGLRKIVFLEAVANNLLKNPGECEKLADIFGIDLKTEKEKQAWKDFVFLTAYDRKVTQALIASVDSPEFRKLRALDQAARFDLDEKVKETAKGVLYQIDEMRLEIARKYYPNTDRGNLCEIGRGSLDAALKGDIDNSTFVQLTEIRASLLLPRNGRGEGTYHYPMTRLPLAYAMEKAEHLEAARRALYEVQACRYENLPELAIESRASTARESVAKGIGRVCRSRSAPHRKRSHTY